MKSTFAALVAGLFATGFVHAQAPVPASTAAPAAGGAGSPVAAPGGVLAGAPPMFGRDLLIRNNCTTACHALDRKIVGPAYYDVALRYKSEPAVAGRLRAKVRAGGTGVWDKMIPMAPNPQVPDADMMIMVAYILALKPPAGYKPGPMPPAGGAAAAAPAPATPAGK